MEVYVCAWARVKAVVLIIARDQCESVLKHSFITFALKSGATKQSQPAKATYNIDFCC